MARNSEPQVVKDGTIAADLIWLRGVLTLSTKWQGEDGTYLMREDPTRGYPVPKEKNPRRPLATQERFERVRAVAEQVRMVVRRGKNGERRRTYLPEVLDLVEATGRRISAILALRFEDLRLDQGEYGSILWPADTDKTGKEWLVPLAKDARKAIDRVLQERPGIGAAFIFPAVTDASKSLDVDVASGWLLEAERLAGLEKQDGSLWHAYRRKWATERKHLPNVDVAAAGGWSALASLQTCYQMADQQTMQQVVSSPARLNEA